jgi:CBS-domain-containing membrane protein
MYEFLQETVANNMTRDVRSVAPETSVGDLYRLFAADGFDAYPVLRGQEMVGLVSKLDALKIFGLTNKSILPRYAEGMATKVEQVMTKDVVAVNVESSLQRVLQLLIRHRAKSLPVLDRRRNLVGIISREDVMRAMGRTVLQHYPVAIPFRAA